MAGASSRSGLLDQYKEFLVKHVHQVTDIEAALKFFSYIIASRLPNATIMTELVYATSNVVRLVNDQILDQVLRPNGTKLRMLGQGSCHRIKQLLATINCVEMFVEVTAETFGGSKGRMLFIILLQCLKASLNLLLVLGHQVSLIRRPPISAMNRTSVEKDSEQVVVLNRTQRMMRSLKSSTAMSSRSWRPPFFELTVDGNSMLPSSTRLTAELISIGRPLVYLATLLKFGETSWIPWTLSAAMDVTSLHLHRKAESPLTTAEELELNTREMELLLYLVRSPLYDRFTKKRLYYLFKALSEVPVLSWFTGNIAQYLDERLRLYSYVWS